MQPRTSLTSNKVSAAFVESDEPRQAHTGCPWHDVRAMLRKVGLRPTRQRMELGWLLFSKGDRHLTAEMLFEEASNARVPVSLATVYNTRSMAPRPISTPTRPTTTISSWKARTRSWTFLRRA